MSSDQWDIDVSFQQARFPIELNLPDASDDFLEDARQAVRREFRESTKWKRLKCRVVTLISKSETGNVYALTVGHSVEFDWTWEGATAFRPLLMKDFEDNQKTLFDSEWEDAEIDDSIIWSGEVLEVDEATGRIFIVISDSESPPRRGSFYVRPFEFLAFLDAVYNEPAFEVIRGLVPRRLAAAIGGVHPEVSNFRPVGLNELNHCWRKSWSVL